MQASQFNDFEDAMQYYTAVKAKADVISSHETARILRLRNFP